MAGLIVKSKLFDKPNLLFTDRELWDLEGIELPDGYDDLKKMTNIFQTVTKKSVIVISQKLCQKEPQIFLIRVIYQKNNIIS